MKLEKYKGALKRREILKTAFEKALKAKEDHYKQRM